MNYVKLTFMMAAAIALKQWLEDQKILTKKRVSFYIAWQVLQSRLVALF